MKIRIKSRKRTKSKIKIMSRTEWLHGNGPRFPYLTPDFSLNPLHNLNLHLTLSLRKARLSLTLTPPTRGAPGGFLPPGAPICAGR